jgi:hypothetical protein
MLRQELTAVCKRHHLLDREVVIHAKVLTAEEAIGNPESHDFPLQKGKERLMQAQFESGRGQAFTDQFGDFTGRLQEVVGMELCNYYRRAVFVAAMNAVLNHVGLVSGTVHCRDHEPAQCAEEIADYIRKKYRLQRIMQIGFQPRLIERIQKAWEYRILDLDPENIGTVKGKTLVEGPLVHKKILNWADLLLVTGTTLVNGTIGRFLGKRPVLFYGTTIAGAAHLMKWERVCPLSR